MTIPRIGSHDLAEIQRSVEAIPRLRRTSDISVLDAAATAAESTNTPEAYKALMEQINRIDVNALGKAEESRYWAYHATAHLFYDRVKNAVESGVRSYNLDKSCIGLGLELKVRVALEISERAPEEAVALLEPELKKRPNHRLTLEVLAQALHQMGPANHERKLAIVKRLQEKNRSDERMLEFLDAVEIGDYFDRLEEAQKLLNEGVLQPPIDNCRRGVQLLEEAHSLAQEACASEKTHGLLWRWSSVANYQLGRFDEAKEHFFQATKFDIETADYIANCSQATPSAAIEYFRRSTKPCGTRQLCQEFLPRMLIPAFVKLVHSWKMDPQNCPVEVPAVLEQWRIDLKCGDELEVWSSGQGTWVKATLREIQGGDGAERIRVQFGDYWKTALRSSAHIRPLVHAAPKSAGVSELSEVNVVSYPSKQCTPKNIRSPGGSSHVSSASPYGRTAATSAATPYGLYGRDSIPEGTAPDSSRSASCGSTSGDRMPSAAVPFARSNSGCSGPYVSVQPVQPRPVTQPYTNTGQGARQIVPATKSHSSTPSGTRGSEGEPRSAASPYYSSTFGTEMGRSPSTLTPSYGGTRSQHAQSPEHRAHSPQIEGGSPQLGVHAARGASLPGQTERDIRLSALHAQGSGSFQSAGTEELSASPETTPMNMLDTQHCTYPAAKRLSSPRTAEVPTENRFRSGSASSSGSPRSPKVDVKPQDAGRVSVSISTTAHSTARTFGSSTTAAGASPPSFAARKSPRSDQHSGSLPASEVSAFRKPVEQLSPSRQKSTVEQFPGKSDSVHQSATAGSRDRVAPLTVETDHKAHSHVSEPQPSRHYSAAEPYVPQYSPSSMPHERIATPYTPSAVRVTAERHHPSVPNLANTPTAAPVNVPRMSSAVPYSPASAAPQLTPSSASCAAPVLTSVGQHASPYRASGPTPAYSSAYNPSSANPAYPAASSSCKGPQQPTGSGIRSNSPSPYSSYQQPLAHEVVPLLPMPPTFQRPPADAVNAQPRGAGPAQPASNNPFELHKRDAASKADVPMRRQWVQKPAPAATSAPPAPSTTLQKADALDLQSLVYHEVLGKGGFGSVYRGFYKGQEVAIKKLHVEDGRGACCLAEFEKEVLTLQNLKHDRLVTMIAAITDPPNLIMVLEYMAGGSLYTLLHAEKVVLNFDRKKLLSLDMACGVSFLHDIRPPAVHRDLKSMNVVLDKSRQRCKICDFGLTQTMEKTHITRKDQEGGSPRYMCPELFDSKTKITEKVDVWALGCLIAETFTGRLPHQECESLPQVMRKLLLEKQGPFSQPTPLVLESKSLLEAVHGALDLEASRRSTARNLLNALTML